MPFLENVTRGRNVPRERLEEVAHHYELFGGVSPINRPEPRADRGARGRARGARHRPADLLREPQLASVPRGHAAGDARRRRAVGAGVLHLGLQLLLGLPPVPRGHLPRAGGGRRRGARDASSCATFYNHPGFVEANADRVRARVRADPARSGGRRRGSSSPRTASRPRWPRAAGTPSSWPRRRHSSRRPPAPTAHSVVYQSRSGPPSVPWLEPDVCDEIRALAAGGRRATSSSRRSGSCPTTSRCSTTSTTRRSRWARRSASTSGAPAPPARIPAFVSMIRELVAERLDPAAGRRAAGRFGPSPDACAPNCCLSGASYFPGVNVVGRS